MTQQFAATVELIRGSLGSTSLAADMPIFTMPRRILWLLRQYHRRNRSKSLSHSAKAGSGNDSQAGFLLKLQELWARPSAPILFPVI